MWKVRLDDNFQFNQANTAAKFFETSSVIPIDDITIAAMSLHRLLSYRRPRRGPLRPTKCRGQRRGNTGPPTRPAEPLVHTVPDHFTRAFKTFAPEKIQRWLAWALIVRGVPAARVLPRGRDVCVPHSERPHCHIFISSNWVPWREAEDLVESAVT